MKTKIEMKTPISYYGGKQMMLKHILPVIPEHGVYVEPFFGGGAVFWGKELSDTEVINDYNGMVMNFYDQLKTNFDALKLAVDATPYSRDAYSKAMVVYKHPYLFDGITKAWAFWVGTVQGFGNKIGSWRCSQMSNKEITLHVNKKEAFTIKLSERLTLVQLENMDAVDLILSKDSEDTFFYVDPPYVGSNLGHYGGYTQEHFKNLLEVLATIKGKFLLSSYPNELLTEFIEKYKWNSREVDMPLSVSKVAGKRKCECLTANYDIGVKKIC